MAKYNPFKMLGSYLGAGITLLMGFWYLTTPSFNLGALVFLFFPFDGRGILLWVFLIMGFLIGWGIHSLIRKLRSR